jgi:hypothetical protein
MDIGEFGGKEFGGGESGAEDVDLRFWMFDCVKTNMYNIYISPRKSARNTDYPSRIP